jgi:hypothetical protein
VVFTLLKLGPRGLIAHGGDGINPLATAFTKFSPGAPVGGARRACEEGEERVEWANLPHDIAETLELVIVSISIVLGLAVLVAFGQWWQR